MDVNTQIKNRILYTRFNESTWYTQDLYGFWVTNFNDPDVLFKVKIYGKYKKLYKWTTEQCDWFIENHLEDSRGHTVDGEWFAYDWGSGNNKITPMHKMHQPNLDHIVPKSEFKKYGGKLDGDPDVPENMRIRVRRLNENKGDTNTDTERWATIYDMLDDMDDRAVIRAKLQAYIDKNSK